MTDKSWMNLLGLMQRARKIVTGEELVVKAIQKKHVVFVIIAADASDNTKKKVTDKCRYYQIPYTFFENRYAIGQAIGKAERVTVGLIDEGFANKFRSLIE